MIELLSRSEVLNLNETFASFIVGVQDAKYNPAHFPYEPGKMYVEDRDESRYVTQEECDKWNREMHLNFNQRKDKVKAKPIEYIDEHVFKYPETNIEKYVKKISYGLDKLTRQLEWESTIFLLDYTEPWLSQKNDYKPVSNALDHLRQLGVSDEFVGGFKASGQELRQLIKSIFWIGRCNASLPSCYFSGLEKGVVGNICKHGNIHFHFYSDTDRSDILEGAKMVELEALDRISCYDNFTDSSKIEGRKIIV